MGGRLETGEASKGMGVGGKTENHALRFRDAWILISEDLLRK